MNGLKLTILILLLVSFVLVMVQNSQPVTFRFLHWQYAVSQLLLIVVVYTLGFLTGVVTVKWPRKKAEEV